jgi:hypothetical protein
MVCFLSGCNSSPKFNAIEIANTNTLYMKSQYDILVEKTEPITDWDNSQYIYVSLLSNNNQTFNNILFQYQSADVANIKQGTIDYFLNQMVLEHFNSYSDVNENIFNLMAQINQYGTGTLSNTEVNKSLSNDEIWTNLTANIDNQKKYIINNNTLCKCRVYYDGDDYFKLVFEYGTKELRKKNTIVVMTVKPDKESIEPTFIVTNVESYFENE